MSRKRLAAICGSVALFAAGFAAVALADTTSTSTSCATTTASKYTLAGPTTTSEFGGDVLSVCATATATATDQTVTGPTTTETVTTTVPGPTTTVTTTAPTFASETAYTQTRPAFTAKRTVLVASGAALKTAVANLLPGDLVKASAPFTLSGGGTTDPLIIANRLAAPAEIDLTDVSIVYTGTGNYNTVWVRNAQNVHIFGGDISMSQGAVGGGACIGWTASQHSLWWGFHVHGCGSTGFAMFTSSSSYSYGGPVSYDDIEGEIDHFSLNHGLFDPHAEKCSGVHGANLADGNFFAFDHNRIALNVHDSACTGGGISFGSNSSPTTSPAGPIPDSNTIILECANLSFVSTSQTGGNCYQAWGYGNTNTDLKYVVSNNIQGHNVWAGGLYSTPNSWLATDTFEYARATSTDLNPRYAGDCTDNKEGNPVFLDAVPAPCYKPFSS